MKTFNFALIFFIAIITPVISSAQIACAYNMYFDNFYIVYKNYIFF